LLRILSILVRSAIIKADHRILHALMGRVHGDRCRIRIIKCALRVKFESVFHRKGRFLLPEGITLLRIERLCQWCFVTNLYRHGIPDKCPRMRKSKIANILRMKYPGCLLTRALLFFLSRFFLRYYENRFVECLLGFPEALLLFTGQYLLRILKPARSAYDMIGWHGDAYLVISEG